MLQEGEVVVFRNQNSLPYWTVISRSEGRLQITLRTNSLCIVGAKFIVRARFRNDGSKVSYHAYIKGYMVPFDSSATLAEANLIKYRPANGDCYFNLVESSERVDRADQVIFKERQVWALNPRQNT